MKYYLIAVMTAILMAGTASAQEVNIGIKGGLNVYNIYQEDNSNADRRIGFHAGLLGHIHLAKHFGLQPEIVYSNQGAEYRSSSVKTKFNLDYINVPLLFQIMFGDGFRLQAGPQVGFLISAKSETDNVRQDHKDELETVELGLTFGASYVGKSGFGIDARYNYGLSDIYENSSYNSTNRGFQLGLFYLFGHR